MKVEDLFNRANIVDLSFFNFRNAITAAYFADSEFKVLKVNETFRRFFPILGSVNNAYFPEVLEQLGVPGPKIDDWIGGLQEDGHVVIPQIKIDLDGETRIYSLLSARTRDESFSYH